MTKAFCCFGKGETGFRNIEVPVCGPLDAILKPLAVCICSSDVHISNSVPENVQLALGHEVVGEIIEVGNLVKDFKVGDKCLVPPVTPNWSSLASQEGNSSHSDRQEGGFKFTSQKPGVFAEKFHVNDADGNLHHLPSDISLKSAVMIGDMMSTGFYGAELADIHYGDTVVVIGIGPVGLMAVAACSIGGAGRIFAVGTRKNCVKLAIEYGATDIVSYKDGNLSDTILNKNGGQVDRVIIAGGDSKTLSHALKMLKPGGVVANVSIFAYKEIVIDWAAFGGGIANKTIKGGLCPGGRLRLEKMTNLVKYKRVDPSKLVNYEFHGFDKIKDAFDLMASKPDDLIKAIVFIEEWSFNKISLIILFLLIFLEMMSDKSFLYNWS